jgi:hypothetical protein
LLPSDIPKRRGKNKDLFGGDGEVALAGIVGEDGALWARGVFPAGEGGEQDRAEDDPAEMERPPCG